MTQKMWHNLSREEVIELLNSDPEKGLSKEEIWARQKRYGPNSLPKEKPLSKLKIFLEQIRSPLIYILIIAGIVVLFFQKFTDAIVIFGAVVLNTVVGFFQENKASKALRELKKVVKIEAQVIRESRQMKIDSKELVPGEIIILTAGNKVPADGRLIESHNLKINEAPLTGEWLTAGKTIEILPAETPMADRDNMVYMGCVVEDGKGKAVVTEIGQNTEMGRVAMMIKETKEEKTPLQKKLAHFSKIIGVFIALICIFIFIGGVLRGRDFVEMFETSVAVAVAAIPEGLPIAMVVILALGMERILKRKGLVRKLVAAETLGSTSIACTDKTLTLTEGKMEISETATLKNEITQEGEKKWHEVFKEKAGSDQTLLITISVLCSEAFVENPQALYPVWIIRGGPTDRSLVLAGAEVGFKKPDLEKRFPKIDEIPFNSQNKFIVTLRKTEAENTLYISGAPEKILELSTQVEIEGKQKVLDKKVKQELNQRLENLTKKGLRVIAVGCRKIPDHYAAGSRNLEELCNDLVFVGFIGLKDPLRKEAKEAINICKKSGMRPILVTGDHLLTAKAVAKELGLKVKKENIIEGKDLDLLSDEEFQKRVKDIEIYARAEPRHKLRIIKTWQERGEVVAMTGDGINDAPALKQADIGVALGSGTDVAKEVSDLVLLTDNFSIIVAAVEEGRVILDNIRKVITYLLSDSFTETILIGVSIIFGLPLPIIAVQILWVNLIEDGPLGLCLAFESKEKDIMTRKPQSHKSPLLTNEMKALIFIIGLVTDLSLLGLFFWLLKYSGYEILHIRSIIFAGLTIDSLFYVFSCKSLRRNLWHINLFSNKFLIVAWIFGMLTLIAAIYLPVLQTLLKTVPLNLFDWQLILGLGLCDIILIEATKWYFISRKSFS